jgi:hypothetical protein
MKLGINIKKRTRETNSAGMRFHTKFALSIFSLLTA